MTETRFNEEEVSLILRRALEDDGGGSDGSLTLKQLKEIAAEVGIDPAGVEKAALAVEANRAAGPRQGGSRTSVRYDIEVDGEVGRDDYGDLLRAVRSATGRQGVVTEAFGGLEWKAQDAFGGRYVTIRSDNGRTRVEALGNFRDGAFVSGSLGATGGLAATAVLLKATLGGIAALGALAPVALIAGAVAPAYLLYRRWFAREDAALRTAVADLAAQMRAQVRAGETDAHTEALPGSASGTEIVGESPGEE